MAYSLSAVHDGPDGHDETTNYPLFGCATGPLGRAAPALRVPFVALAGAAGKKAAATTSWERVAESVTPTEGESKWILGGCRSSPRSLASSAVWEEPSLVVPWRTEGRRNGS